MSKRYSRHTCITEKVICFRFLKIEVQIIEGHSYNFILQYIILFRGINGSDGNYILSI